MNKRIDAGPDTVHWGYFDASLPPLVTVESAVRQSRYRPSQAAKTLCRGRHLLFPETLRAIQESVLRKLPGHICTGPVAVRGAQPGQVLEVRIRDIKLHYDWGYNFVRPLAGALPDDFDENYLMYIALDEDRMIGQLPWGTELELRPFFGVMGVAPPPAWGMVSTLPPRRNGGNLDNKELLAGSTLYLSIFVEGANFSVGDGHGAQGDGEVCVTAVETGLIGTFELHVRSDMSLTWPLAETPTHIMTMAFDPDLDDCVVIALRQMIDLIVARTGLERHQAYALCSLAADVRVTQVVNGNKGIHVMLAKQYLQRA